MKKFLVLCMVAGFAAWGFGRSIPVMETGKAKASVLERCQFQFHRMQQDETGVHMRYRQVVDGIEVWGGEIIRHYNQKRQLMLVTGRIHEGVHVGTVPVLTMEDAVSRVRESGVDPSLTVHPVRLVIFPGDNDNYYLAYVVDVHGDAVRDRYFVDAETGTILFSYDNLKTRGGPPSSGDDTALSPAVGSGIGVLGQSVTGLNTGFTGTLYQAVNLTRGAEIKTYSMASSRRLPGVLASDSDNYWTDGSVVDAHKYLENVYDFYLNVFNRKSFDDNNSAMIASVHYGTDYVNAYWNGTQMVFGDGDGEMSTSLAGALDVIAHELTHAVTDYTSDLIYYDESGALNEAFSDIMGTCVEFYWQPEGFGLLKAEYWMGEDIWYPNNPFGDALRYLDDPNKAWNGYTDSGYDPCHYDERYTGTADNGGVHINSTIVSHWFYLLAHGGTNAYSGISVNGIGLADAQALTYQAFTEYMPAGATFSDARAVTLSVAATLFGSGSVQYNTAATAWDAVGVY